MAKILAIDPGTFQSAYVRFDTEKKEILEMGVQTNDKFLSALRSDISYEHADQGEYVVEGIASYVMAVGKSVFETCYMIGRILEITGATIVYREDIKLHLCGTTKAKDANIRQALIDRFELGLEPRKRPSRILKGVSKDVWSAVAVAVYYGDMVGEVMVKEI